jgi:pilus assembly protein Flp/PilA
MTSLRGIKERLSRFLDHDSEDAQGMVEYALILVLIAIVVIAILIVLGGQVQNVFSDTVSGLGT